MSPPTRALQIMSKNLVRIPGETSLGEVSQLMRDKKVRHVLVVDGDGVMLGILSDRDVKRFISPFVGSQRETDQDRATVAIKVENVMTKDVESVDPDTTVKEIAERLLQKSIHAVPVLSNGKPVGIVTATDLLRYLVGEL